MNNKLSIVTVTTLVILATGLIAIPSIDQQQAHASLIKDSAKKVTNLIKKVVSKIFNKGGGNGGPGGSGSGE